MTGRNSLNFVIETKSENEPSIRAEKVYYDKIVRLNVGGTRFLTSDATISKYGPSMLSKLLECNFGVVRDELGYIFIDRDGERFRNVLNFLRSATLPNWTESFRFEELLDEADFFGLDELKSFVQNKILTIKDAKKQLLAEKQANIRFQRQIMERVQKYIEPTTPQSESSPTTPNTLNLLVIGQEAVDMADSQTPLRFDDDF